MKKVLLKTTLLALATIIGTSFSFTINAQNATALPAQEPHPDCLTKAPGEAWENWFQGKIAEYKNDLANGRTVVSYTIPVIVHVLYKGSTEGTIGTGANLKAAQIKAQIDALNDAFGGNAPGNSNLPSPFANVDANDIQIRFCLAVKDKNGNTLTEPGIDRIDWQAKNWSDPTGLQSNLISYFDGTIKPASIWDPTKYCNIWVADFLSSSGSGTIGYAKFPAASTLTLNVNSSDVGTSSNDGIVMASRCFGCKTKFSGGYYSQDAYAFGITTVHEAGHWLGLRHISGDSSCGDDYCSDTPPQKGGNNGCSGGLNWGCPSYPFQANQCSGNSNGEMFMDFMDYSNDNCRSLFTAGQETRMMTAMANATYRKLLGTHGVCNTSLSAAFTSNKTSICPGTTVTFTDQSTNGTPTSWKWTFTGGNPSSSTSQNPTVSYSSPGTYDVKLRVSDGATADSITKTAYIVVAGATALPFAYGFEPTTFVPTGWTLSNPDNKTTWARTTSASRAGSASLWFNSKDYSCNGCIDEITLPNLDLASNTALLTFQLAYQLGTDPSPNIQWSDTLQVLLSTDCGVTWSSVYKKFGTNLTTTTPTFSSTAFVPTASQWRMESIVLPSKANAMIKFRAISDYENNLYIDDINITTALGIDPIARNEDMLKVSPNPNDGNFNVVFNADVKATYLLEVKNVLGQVIYHENLDNFAGVYSKQLNVSEYGKGIYLISLTNSTNESVKKVIVY